jgi:hypothetical protein
MGLAKPVTLGATRFETMGEAAEFFKGMLNRYDIGQHISDEDGSMLLLLLSRHEEETEKVGVGVAHFSIMRADYGTRCFQIIRTDGSNIDFSYVHCLKSQS